MKTKRTFLVLASTMLWIGVSFAQYPFTNYRTINVHSTTDWIEADGDDNEACWSAPGVTEQPINRNLNAGDASGYSATFKAVYDEYFLYLFVKVIDDTYVPYNAASMTAEYNIDNIEIFFDSDPTRRNLVGENIEASAPSFSQLRVSIGNTENRATGRGYAAGFIDKKNQISGYEYGSQQTATGYNAEIVIPWDIVVHNNYIANLEPGKKILFDVNAANCTSYTSNRVVMFGWSSEDTNAYRYNAMLGEMVFGEEPSGIESISISNVAYEFTAGQLTLKNTEGNVPVSIYDISGRLVKSVIYSGKAIDLTTLDQGVYLVNVQKKGNFKIIVIP